MTVTERRAVDHTYTELLKSAVPAQAKASTTPVRRGSQLLKRGVQHKPHCYRKLQVGSLGFRVFRGLGYLGV